MSHVNLSLSCLQVNQDRCAAALAVAGGQIGVFEV